MIDPEPAATMATTTPAPQTVRLQAFPDSSAALVRSLTVELGWTAEQELSLTYRLEGELDAIALPPPRAPGFADNLWQHTCFEAFVADAASPDYREFNFSPSGLWASYSFSGYREGGKPSNAPTPRIAFSRFQDRLELVAILATAALPPATNATWRLGLSAVIEGIDGQRSYWALAHPAERPDFHHRDAFILELSDYPNAI